MDPFDTLFEAFAPLFEALPFKSRLETRRLEDAFLLSRETGRFLRPPRVDTRDGLPRFDLPAFEADREGFLFTFIATRFEPVDI